MPRKKRIWFPGAIYHIMSRGNRKTTLFRNPEDYLQFLEYLKMIQEQYPFKLHAICLMTNHFHLELETTDTDLSYIMQRILTLYAKDFNEKYSYVGHVFQGRYVACLIETDQYFLEVSRYIHLNPVKAKMVNSPALYPYSSYSCYISDSIPNKPENTFQTLLSSMIDTSRILGQLNYRRDVYKNYVESKAVSFDQEKRIQKDIREDDFGEPLDSSDA